MTKKNKENKTVETEVEAGVDKFGAINKILDLSKDKFENGLIIGILDDGSLAFNTNVPNYQFMQWLLSKAQLELHIHERSQQNQPTE